MVMRSLTVAGLAVLASCAAIGREMPTKPAFEVASVKPTPSVSGEPIGMFTYPGGRINATNYTLKMLIHEAYDLDMYRILGGPHWVDDDRFDVEAKPPASSQSSKWIPASFKSSPNAEMRQMLQTLLADRFQLKTHSEAKKESVYALVAVKGGHNLKEPDNTKQPSVSQRRNGSVSQEATSLVVHGQNATMAQLAAFLTNSVKRPVSDRTGIKGNFDFDVEYAETDRQAEAAPTLLRALADQIGLKLEAQPGSVEVLVIDHAEKPSRN